MVWWSANFWLRMRLSVLWGDRILLGLQNVTFQIALLSITQIRIDLDRKESSSHREDSALEFSVRWKRNGGEERPLGFPRRATPQTPLLASDDKRGRSAFSCKKMQASIHARIHHTLPVHPKGISSGHKTIIKDAAIEVAVIIFSFALQFRHLCSLLTDFSFQGFANW